MQLPPARFLPRYTLLPASHAPSAALSGAPSEQLRGNLLSLQQIQPHRVFRKFKPTLKSTTCPGPAETRMSKRWGSPEPNDFETFLHRSISNQETPKREIERIPERTAKSATPSPMPKPKIKSDFVAWGEYTGNGKDEDFIAWKKRQLGEMDPANKDRTTRDQDCRSQSADRAKENKVPSQRTSPQSNDSANKSPQRKLASGKNAVKKGQN